MTGNAPMRARTVLPEEQRPDCRPSKGATEPKITIDRLNDCASGALRAIILNGPRGISALTDLDGWVQSQNRRRPEQEDERADRKERQRGIHLRTPIAQASESTFQLGI